MVKVFDFDGHELSRLEPSTSFTAGLKLTPIATTAFHPHRMILGYAARGDNHIHISACGNEVAAPFVAAFAAEAAAKRLATIQQAV